MQSTMLNFDQVFSHIATSDYPDMDEVARAFLQDARFEADPLRANSWQTYYRAHLPNGRTTQLRVATNGLAFFCGDAGSARFTHPETAQNPPTTHRNETLRIVELYTRGSDLEIAIAEAEGALKGHDWYFSCGDDHSVYAAGMANWERIQRMLAQLPFETAEQLYLAHTPSADFHYTAEMHNRYAGVAA